MEVVAVLVASFSLREEEPNPCNVRLAKEAIRICDELVAEGYMPLLVTQWEVDLALRQMGTFAEYEPLSESQIVEDRIIPYGGTIGQMADGRYLGTREVYEGALELFRHYGCTAFVGVAQAFIHQPYLYMLARKDFRLIWKRTRGIGYDKQSTQWWCRSWWQFAFQAFRLMAGSKHGYKGKQAKA